jgi:hypothetical protein
MKPTVIVQCQAPRVYAAPAPSPEVVYIPERQTRTAIVMGIAVEVPA